MSQLRVSSIATTAGTSNITLSSNGVGLDNKPIISGQVGTTATFAATQIVPFDDFWVQNGITYNSSTRRFTVPVSGTYRITMNPFKLSSSASARIRVGINTDSPTGSNHRGMCYGDNASVYQTMNINSVVNLSANDYIVFVLAEGSLYNNTTDRFNQFSIERIA